LQPYYNSYPDLAVEEFGPDTDFAMACDGADLVIVHEWNDPALVAALGRLRASGGRFLLLFHDTHHRAVSEPDAMGAYSLEAYDGILAFGETLAAVYRGWGWGRRVFTWHEAADTRVFHPPLEEQRGQSVVWIGNWGDGERSRELENFLFGPVQEAGLPLTVFGVRYPPEALALLRQYGVDYRGWLANALAPGVFAQHMATIHVPRQFYASQLTGIPTIRVFEALACGIPLISAPWTDSEGLFTPGSDFLMAKDGEMMKTLLKDVRADATLRRDLATRGLQTIRARHTCAHRVDELLAITARLTGRSVPLQEEAG
jgi:spore maturation protein CgeB